MFEFQKSGLSVGTISKSVTSFEKAVEGFSKNTENLRNVCRMLNNKYLIPGFIIELQVSFLSHLTFNRKDFIIRASRE